MTKNKLRLWFQSVNQSNKLNLSNETISSTRIPEETDYSNYNGFTYFHLLSDEFYLICQNILDKETRINLMVLYHYGHNPSTYYRLINKPLGNILL